MPPRRQPLPQHEDVASSAEVALGTARVRHPPFARRSSPTVEGPTDVVVAPAATQASDVVQATVRSGTAMLIEGMPEIFTTPVAVPQPASTTPPRRIVATARQGGEAFVIARFMVSLVERGDVCRSNDVSKWDRGQCRGRDRARGLALAGELD